MGLNLPQTTTVATGIPIPSGANAQQAAFITKIWPYVQRESLRTGIPPEVFIIQSGLETGWGTSWLFTHANNPAGIGAFDNSHGAQFASLSDGFATYADRLMGHGEGGQGQFVADVQAGASAATLLSDIQRGPWAAGHYGGSGLTNTLSSLYGGSGGHSTKGTGGPGGTGRTGGSGGTDATTTSFFDAVAGGALQGVLGPVGSILGLIPGVSGLKAIDVLAGTIVNVFANWRWMLELFGGAALALGGIAIILNDVGSKKAPQLIKAVAAA